MHKRTTFQFLRLDPLWRGVKSLFYSGEPPWAYPLVFIHKTGADYEKADAQKKTSVADLEAKVTAQSKDLEDLKAQLAKSAKPAAKAKEAPKAKKTK